MNTLLITDPTIPHELLKPLEQKNYLFSFLKKNETLTPHHLKETSLLIITHNDRVTKEHLGRAPHLNAIITCSAGIDHIDTSTCKERGIRVYNAPGSNANAVAEHTIALLFAVLRHVAEADRSIRAGHWENERFLSAELEGKTVGLIGFGAIGTLVARKLTAFNVHVLVYDPYLAPADITARHATPTPLNTLLTTSDIISLHIPHTPSTYHLIGTPQLNLMKKTAIVINTARGHLIDEHALINALQHKRIAGAGLDVFEHEPHINPLFTALDNVVLTPHIAYLTKNAHERMVQDAITAFLKDHSHAQ